MKRRMKLELVLAILMTLAIASLAIYASLPRNPDNRTVLFLRSTKSVDQSALQGTSIQQVITENIQGELRKGEFETTVEGLKNLTSVYGGRIPNLHMTMSYGREHWNVNCRQTMLHGSLLKLENSSTPTEKSRTS